jgi:hypothetical protein
VHSTSAQHSHASMCASHLAACRPQLGEHRRPSSNCWNVSLAIKRGDGKCSVCELRHGGVKQHLFTVIAARQKAKTTQRRKRKSEERETAQHAASRTGHVRSSASATWQSMVRVVHICTQVKYLILDRASIHTHINQRKLRHQWQSNSSFRTCTRDAELSSYLVSGRKESSAGKLAGATWPKAVGTEFSVANACNPSDGAHVLTKRRKMKRRNVQRCRHCPWGWSHAT